MSFKEKFKEAKDKTKEVVTKERVEAVADAVSTAALVVNSKSNSSKVNKAFGVLSKVINVVRVLNNLRR